MNLLEHFHAVPHLWNPAALAIADTNGNFQTPKHVMLINELLVEVLLGQLDRLIINAPFQHGKSWISSHYFPAWVLLLFPTTRILLAAHEERFASSFGQKVKDVLERWGKPHGIELRKDSKAKNEWVIQNHGGGMVCRGMHGSLTGRPCDMFLIDDPIKDAEQAMSATIMEKHWSWYQTVVYGRLGPKAPIVLVMTRWGKQDLTGKILEEAKVTGETWKQVKIPAIARENDLLGRKPGEPLWEERVPLARLEMIQKSPKRVFFETCWQQEPQDIEGAHFKPRNWPRYIDLGDAYSFEDENRSRRIYLKHEVMKFATLDWAWSTKQTADCTATEIFGLTPCGRLLILHVDNVRLRPEQLASHLGALCDAWHPRLVAAEVGHPMLADSYRRYPSIGEIRWLTTGGKDKLVRALPAILMGENKRILLPSDHRPWTNEFLAQVGGFTGINDEHDDMVDALSYGATVAQQLKPTLGQSTFGDNMPGMLVGGKEAF